MSAGPQSCIIKIWRLQHRNGVIEDWIEGAQTTGFAE